jgi:hypothetical protein
MGILEQESLISKYCHQEKIFFICWKAMNNWWQNILFYFVSLFWLEFGIWVCFEIYVYVSMCGASYTTGI